MGTRKTNFATGEFYHIYNRGNSKQKIFLDNQDYDRFIKLLYLCNSNKSINFREDIIDKKIDVFDFDRGETIVSIGAWVLMPNHFHLYITVSQRSFLGDEGVSVFMKKVGTSYSMYFNKKYARTGALFEGKFKSTHVDYDGYAKYTFSYIHLNPIKLIDPNWRENGVRDNNKILDFLSNYSWSSYNDYRGISRKENKILSLQDFPDYFANPQVLNEEIFDWINFNPKGLSFGDAL